MLPSHGPKRPRECRANQCGATELDRACSARPLHLVLARKLDRLPKDLGIALMGLGAVGLVIPGPVPLGGSLMVVGTALVWPALLARFGGWLTRRVPWMLRALIGFVDRLQSDLERRYPGSVLA